MTRARDVQAGRARCYVLVVTAPPYRFPAPMGQQPPPSASPADPAATLGVLRSVHSGATALGWPFRALRRLGGR